MEITIVNAYGRTNRGDSVLLDECIHELKCKYPEANISVVLFDDEGFDIVHPDIMYNERICNTSSNHKRFNIYFYKVYSFLILVLSALFKIRILSNLLSREQKITFERILDSDLVISAPGGYLHDTNFALYVALMHLHIANVFNIKTILAPQSYGPIKSFFGRSIFKYILNKCYAICAREGYSYTFLLNAGVKESLIFKTGDSAFWNFNLDHSECKYIFERHGVHVGEKFLGMTCVDWTYPHQLNPIDKRRIYINNMVEIINRIHDNFGMRTLIFNQVKDDLNISEEIAKSVPNKVVHIKEDYEPEILRSLISFSHVFLATRFHSCIFSLMSDVPTTAIAYLPKTDYILKDLGIYDKGFDINDMPVDSIYESLSFDITNNKEARETVRFSVEKYRRNMNRLMDII
ncbi:polysaccharide pyruvyl transferase family protein [Shewanella litoralis]|uniref:Polysaccharide pyruvyl transferase domain-containing protein n=1 Tax=Shewanella litoralis TaxID=2282700 RepID=A0ABQ2R6Q2_9GAMM|nr:polysaccharide pyruvyl transferase family protein [Shewanella litoralis]GGQ16696.1 hypothetical protein GCM10009411_16220 [Shewanella litoralis]